MKPSRTWRYFKYSEFKCKCGCGKNNTKPKLIDMLDGVRTLVGRKMIVNSGCRCEPHNTEIGGNLESEHLDGEAGDIQATTGKMKFLLVKYGLSMGFTRIGISTKGGFVHLGISKSRAQEVIWLY